MPGRVAPRVIPHTDALARKTVEMSPHRFPVIRVLMAFSFLILIGSACGSGHSPSYSDGYNWAKYYDRPGWVNSISDLTHIGMRTQADRVCMTNSLRQMPAADHQADWVQGCKDAIDALPDIAPK